MSMSGVVDIGRALATARRNRGLTQRELGRLIGVKQQQVARWEATRYCSAALVRVDQVARTLGIRLALVEVDTPLAAEATATYPTTSATPANDLAEVVSRIRAHGGELQSRFTMRRLGVYGSFVCGEQRAQSDIDLLAELDVIGFDNEFGAAVYLQDLLGRRVDFALPSELRPELRERVLDEVLYVWEA